MQGRKDVYKIKDKMTVNFDIDTSANLSASPPPPLIPRRPARRLVPAGPLPRRKIPAVPPPVELDPIEQNRINEAVWVQRAEVDDNTRPRVPERARRSAIICDRTTSAPASHGGKSSPDLPFDLSQVVQRPEAHQFGSHHRVHDVLVPCCGVHRLSQNHLPPANQLNALSMSRQNINNSLPRTLIPTMATVDERPPQDVVTLPRWPIPSSSSAERDRMQSLELAGSRIKSRQDNEYVACPTLGVPDDVGMKLPGAEELLAGVGERMPRTLLTNDGVASALMTASKSSNIGSSTSEKLHAKLTVSDDRTLDCVMSGSLVCQKCGGCRCKSCTDADQRVQSTIEFCSCAGPIRYLCQSELSSEDAEFLDDHLGHGAGRRQRGRRCRHVALGVLVAALCLPCLCCYWPMKAGHEAVSACRRRFTGQLGVCRCPDVDCVDSV